MKKAAIIILITLFCACKKDNPVYTNKLSERFINLTTNKWAMIHEYNDSTNYAKNNLSLWPLSTTEDYLSTWDTCTWDSKIIFLKTGECKLEKSSSCDPSISSDVGNWKLINHDNDFVIAGQDTMHIVELTNNYLKMWYESYTYVGGQVVLIEYRMWVYNSVN